MKGDKKREVIKFINSLNFLKSAAIIKEFEEAPDQHYQKIMGSAEFFNPLLKKILIDFSKTFGGEAARGANLIVYIFMKENEEYLFEWIETLTEEFYLHNIYQVERDEDFYFMHIIDMISNSPLFCATREIYKIKKIRGLFGCLFFHLQIKDVP